MKLDKAWSKYGDFVGRLDVIDKLPMKLFEKPLDSLNDTVNERSEDWWRFERTLNEKVLLRSKAVIYVLLFSFAVSAGYGAYELIRGDHPIYKEVPNGAMCNDGWRSSSQGPGTCSWHGGVDYYIYKDVEVGFHVANPTPFFALGGGIALIFIVYLFKDRYARRLAEVIFSQMGRGIVLTVWFFMMVPFMLLRVAVQLVLFAPMLVVYIFMFTLGEVLNYRR